MDGNGEAEWPAFTPPIPRYRQCYQGALRSDLSASGSCKTKESIFHAGLSAAAISWSLRCPRFHDATRSSGFRLQRNGRASLALWCPV